MMRKVFLAAAFALAVAALTVDAGTGVAATNSIAVENSRPGTTSWFITTPDQAAIAGYFGRVSYLPGQNATLFVNSHGDDWTYTVYRMGYYQGLGGRKVAKGSVAQNAPQPDPTVSGDFYGGPKLLTTGWHGSTVIPLGADWVSGYYLVKLHDDVNGGESYAGFVLRSPNPAPIVINLSTNTWQAYNLWDNLSLYRDSRVSPALWRKPVVPHQVSFLRPYLDEWGAGKFFLYDRPLVAWAEEHGYPVSYSSDEDVRHAREAGPSTKLVIFSGHEEYYSMADRTELERLTARGVSEAFFGGNAWAWQARFNDATHVMSVWRKKSLDPGTNPQQKTVRWESVGMPQDAITGTMQTWGTQTGTQGAYATSSWPWNGAGVVSGEDLGPMQGSEWDGIAVNPFTPHNLIMLSRTPFSGMPNVPADQAMTLWQKTPRAFVFAAGQTGFNWNLAYPGVTPATWIGQTRYPASSQVNPAIERLAGNLIQRATGIANPIAPIAPTGTSGALAILAPAAGQDVAAAPNPLSVSWSDPPAGTAAVRVFVGATQVASSSPAGNVLITAGIRKLGTHAIRVVAVDSSGQVLARTDEQVDVLSATDAIFRQNPNRLSRIWDSDDADAVTPAACYRQLPSG